jgi:hypothetical protein
MIYLAQDFDIHPATPETRDRFIEAANEQFLPAQTAAGGTLLAAWFSYSSWFYRITQVIEFPDLATYDGFRRDGALRSAVSALSALCADTRDELLEPLGPVPTGTLDDAIAASHDNPEEVYTCAILEVNPGRMEDFTKLLAMGAPNLPILASWRPVSGNPNLVIDLWKGNLEHGYRASTPAEATFFTPLRDVAPKERLVTCYPLPYSPLK